MKMAAVNGIRILQHAWHRQPGLLNVICNAYGGAVAAAWRPWRENKASCGRRSVWRIKAV